MLSECFLFLLLKFVLVFLILIIRWGIHCATLLSDGTTNSVFKKNPQNMKITVFKSSSDSHDYQTPLLGENL